MVVFIVLLIIFIVVTLSYAAHSFTTFQKDRRLQAKDIASNLDTKIAEIYKEITGSEGTTSVHRLNVLYDFVKKSLTDPERRFVAANKIETTKATSSMLGYCGVSETHLYWDMDRTHDYDELLTKGSLSNLYTKIRDAHKETVDGKPNYNYTISGIWAKDVEETLSQYLSLKRNGCQFTSQKLSLDDIKYFNVTGSQQYVSNVSGGGVNLQGAAVGAVLGGGAAAIIGSQLGTEISTTVKEIDNRKVFMVIKKDGHWVNQDLLSSNVDATLAALRALIPEKEENVAQIEDAKPSTNTATITEELKQYKDLLDAGLITQDDFDAKKKQILGL